MEELRGQEEANKQNTNKSQTRMSSRCRQHDQTQKARFTFRQQSRKTDVKLPKQASNSNATNYGNALKTYCTCTNIYTHIHRTYIPVCVNIARHTTVQIFWGGGKQSSSAAAEGFSHKHTFKKKKEKQQKLIKQTESLVQGHIITGAVEGDSLNLSKFSERFSEQDVGPSC